MPELSPAAGDMAGDDTQATSQQPTLAEIAAASQQMAASSQQMAAASQQQQMVTASQQHQIAAAIQRPKGTSKEGAAKPIGMACRACRLRKIRCGGERPRCTYCVKKGYECVLTPHKKRGRPRKTEQRSQHRQQRSDAAEIQPSETEEMRGMTMPVDGLDLDVRQLWAELTGLQGLDLPPELSALAANSATQAQDTASIPNIGPSFNLGQSLGQVDAGMLAYAANYAFPKFDTAKIDPASVVTEEREARDSPASSTHRSATGDAECPRSATPSNVQPMVDASVQAYFTYVQPWFPILHRPTFERQINEGCVDVLLYCAVQAIAARFCDSAKKSRRPYRRGQRFARRARELLPEALKTARLSTLQAITLLALYMSVSGQWQEGAAYEKLAVQLAFIGQYHLLDEEFLLPPVTNNMGVYEAG
ncbi:hypothetical protein IWW56_005990, partial [Coemansia sp. RSA 2131]